MIAAAEGDASRFKQVLTEYAKAPQVTRDRLYINAMRDMYSNVTKVMIDSRGGASLLNLPLDRLLQQAAAGSAPSGPVAPPAAPLDAPPASGAVDVRSREGQRGRDREGR